MRSHRIRGRYALVLAIAGIGSGISPVSAQVTGPNRYDARRAPRMIIDGVISAAEWSKAAWTSDFVDIEGSVKPNPTFRTRAKMMWDDNYLYIAAELEEPHVWATLKERDAVIFHDNDFEVFIDPDQGDTFNYYEFEMNALNTVWDLLLTKPYRDNGDAINAWDIAGLKSAVHISGTINNPRDRDTGWTVEIAMPWSVLKEAAREHRKPKPGEEWRINFSRVEWDVDVVANKYVKRKQPEHNWVWSPQGAIAMHMPEKWGYIKFVDDGAH